MLSLMRLIEKLILLPNFLLNVHSSRPTLRLNYALKLLRSSSASTIEQLKKFQYHFFRAHEINENDISDFYAVLH